MLGDYVQVGRFIVYGIVLWVVWKVVEYKDEVLLDCLRYGFGVNYKGLREFFKEMGLLYLI